MKIITPGKGLKTREGAIARLNRVVGNRLGDTLGHDIRGMVIVNEDGTFTPAVVLIGNDVRYARHFAENGIYVMG